MKTIPTKQTLIALQKICEIPVITPGVGPRLVKRREQSEPQITSAGFWTP